MTGDSASSKDQRRSAIRSHRDLIVWQKAMDLVVLVYELTAQLPPTERYRLVDQLCRAAVSVPANIAEGSQRTTARDYANFVSIAKGSLMEVETMLMLTVRLRMLNETTVSPAFALVTEISKMLTSLRARLLRS